MRGFSFLRFCRALINNYNFGLGRMAEGIPTAFAVDLSGKWRALAERRKAHLVDLYVSGRWRHYYNEQDFILRLREAFGAVEKWSATEQSARRRAATGSICQVEAINGARFDKTYHKPITEAHCGEAPAATDAEMDAVEEAYRVKIPA